MLSKRDRLVDSIPNFGPNADDGVPSASIFKKSISFTPDNFKISSIDLDLTDFIEISLKNIFLSAQIFFCVRQ